MGTSSMQSKSLGWLLVYGKPMMMMILIKMGTWWEKYLDGDLLHSSCQTLWGLILCTKPQNKILRRFQHLNIIVIMMMTVLLMTLPRADLMSDDVDNEINILFYLSSNILHQLIILIPSSIKILTKYFVSIYTFLFFLQHLPSFYLIQNIQGGFFYWSRHTKF